MNVRTIRRVDLYLGSLMICILKPVVLLVGKITSRNHQPEIRDDVVFMKLLGGGSLLLALPSLIAFRRQYPDTRIRLLTTRDVKPFADVMGVLDECIVVDVHGLGNLIRSGIRSYLACFRADTMIDLEVHSRMSSVFSVLACARNRIGFCLEDAYWRRGISTHLVYYNSSAGSYHFYEKILQVVGVEPVSFDACRTHVLEVIGGPNPDWNDCLVVGCTCSGMGAERELSPTQWLQVFQQRMDAASEQTVCILGSPSDRPAADAVIDCIKPAFPNLRFQNLCGKTSLSESLQVLAAAERFWGIDSGLLHFARLFGVSCVSYWGPTDPETRLKPIPGLVEETIYQPVPCSPCIHVTEDPPCRGDNICIQNLFTEQKRDWIGLIEDSQSGRQQ